MHNKSSLVLIYSSIFVAMMLMLLPVPIFGGWFRPSWVTLVLIFWVLAVPAQVGIGTAWIVGLMLDVITNVPFGVHAFTLVCISYFLIRFNKVINEQSYVIRTLIIFLLLVLAQFFVFFFQTLPWYSFAVWMCLLQASVDILIWLALAVILSACQRRAVRFAS